jgi:pimeloyl-ACP methyl ester carboxylesterase
MLPWADLACITVICLDTHGTREGVSSFYGAFADASAFGGVIRELTASGYNAVAVPNPLRGLAFDADALSSVVRAIDGPVVLVGHSYGGAVISQASTASTTSSAWST